MSPAFSPRPSLEASTLSLEARSDHAISPTKVSPTADAHLGHLEVQPPPLETDDRPLVVIPARYASSRLPGKPLALIRGKPMILHVLSRLEPLMHPPGNPDPRLKEGIMARVLVATDDARIQAVVQAAGFEAQLTSPHCRNGSERVAEVLRRSAAPCVVNVQGDEPFVAVEAVQAVLARLLATPPAGLVTLCRPLASPLERQSPHAVKVQVDGAGRALSFARQVPDSGDYALHIGIYGYSRETLLHVMSLPETENERRERLEQLRALEAGIPIQVLSWPGGWLSVDTPEDLAAAEAWLAGQEERTEERAGP